MPTDFGIRGGNQQGANAAQRLQGLGRAEARALLRDIETQIAGPSGTKPGVLKLVNLGDAARNVSLERKSLLQRMFVADGRSMRTTADTLKHLFEAAGVDQQVLTDLTNYLERRDNRAGTRTVASLIARGLTTVGAESGASAQEALAKLGIRPDSNAAMGQGSFGQVVQAERADRAQTRVYKQVNPDHHLSALRLAAPRADGTPRLERVGPASSAYLGKNITGVVRPEVYLVRETRPGNAPPVFHAVEGDKNFKTWAARHLQSNPGAQLALAGVLMHAARGEVGMDLAGSLARIEQPALHKAALDGLQTLKQLSAGGFVHGDLKPLNMFFDPEAGKVQFIDVDSMKKMRKGQQGCEVTHTSAYSHPNARGRTGFEQDLFGLGLSVLMMSLPNASPQMMRSLESIRDYNLQRPPADDPGFQQLRQIIRAALPADLNATQIMALNWIGASLDHDAPVTDRYGAPVQGQAREHLLDRVDPARHSNISSRLAGMPPAAQPVANPPVVNQPPANPAPANPQPRAQNRAAPPGPAIAQGAQIVGAQAAGAQNGAVDAAVLARAVDRILDGLYGLSESFRFPADDRRAQTNNLVKLQDQLNAWSTSPEGQQPLQTALQGHVPGSEGFRKRLEEVLTDRANLLHLRLYVAADPALNALSDGDKARLERKLAWASREQVHLLTTEALLNRVGLGSA